MGSIVLSLEGYHLMMEVINDKSVSILLSDKVDLSQLKLFFKLDNSVLECLSSSSSMGISILCVFFKHGKVDV